MVGIAIGFKDLDYSMNVMKDLMNKPWVGFDNFIKFIQDAQFKTVMWNTLSLGVLELVITFPIPIFFALMLNELRSRKFKKSIQTISYLPYFISMVVVCGMVKTFTESTGVFSQISQVLALASANRLDHFVKEICMNGNMLIRMDRIRKGVTKNERWLY